MWPHAAVLFSSHLGKRKFRRERPRSRSSRPLDHSPAPHPQPLSGRAAPTPSLRPRPRGKRGGNEAVPPLPEGPRGRGPHRTRAAEPPVEGLATKSRAEMRPEGGAVRAARKGGGATRARARSSECPDAALRQSGPERAAGDVGEKRIRRPSISIRASHSQSISRVPPNPHLKEGGSEGTTSRPTRGAREAKQNGDIGLPLPPLSAASSHWCEEKILHSIAARVPQKNKSRTERE